MLELLKLVQRCIKDTSDIVKRKLRRIHFIFLLVFFEKFLEFWLEVRTILVWTFIDVKATARLTRESLLPQWTSSLDRLDKFINEFRDSKVNGFINGIEKDIAPIKNAISFPYSSGFVEGNNNKFKLLKRILYGRSKLVNLFKKCYVPFLMNNTDFKLVDLIKQKTVQISCTV